MFRVKLGLILSLCVLSLLLVSCTGGNSHLGSMMGKYNKSGGELKLNGHLLIIPPESTQLTDDGLEEAKGGESSEELTIWWSMTESAFTPDFYIPGTVVEISAVSNFEAFFASPLTLRLHFEMLSLPEAYGIDDLVVAYYDVLTGALLEIEGSLVPTGQQVEAPIMNTGIYYLKPRSFAGRLLGSGSTLEYRAASEMNLTGFNPSVPPWTFKNLDLAHNYQVAYKRPELDTPSITEFPAAEMVVRYDASTVLGNNIWGDVLDALSEAEAWPTKGMFSFIRQSSDGVVVLGDLILDPADAETLEIEGTLSSGNFPGLRWDGSGFPAFGSLISEGVVSTSAGNFFASVYRFDFLPGSPAGWTSYTWYAEVEEKNVPVSVVISNNADTDGNLIPAFTRCTVFDLATPIIF